MTKAIEARKTALRRSLRRTRQAVPDQARQAAAVNICERTAQQDFFQTANTIVFYQDVDGEVSPQLLLKAALQAGKTCCLPIVPTNRGQPLMFAPITATTKLVRNKWGILEPPANNRLLPNQLDLALLPLVAFDPRGASAGHGPGLLRPHLSLQAHASRAQAVYGGPGL